MEQQIQRIIAKMSEFEPHSEDYFNCVEALEKMVDTYGKMIVLQKLSESEYVEDDDEDDGEHLTFVFERSV